MEICFFLSECSGAVGNNVRLQGSEGNDTIALLICAIYLPSWHTTTTAPQRSLSSSRWQGWSCRRLEWSGSLSAEKSGYNLRLTFSLCGPLTVSSTLKINEAASVALLMAFILTKLGSQTKASMLSRTPSGPSTSTPNQMCPFA